MLQQLARRVQAVEIGHSNVDDHHVRIQLQSLLHGFATVTGLAADFPTFVFLQQRAQTSAHYLVIVS